MKIKLTATGAQIAGVIAACDRARKGTRLVKVDRDAIMALIVDQSRLVHANRLEVEPDQQEQSL